MFMKLWSLLFICSTFVGVWGVIFGVSWFAIWVGLELNLLSFLPLVMARGSSSSVEAGLKYFFIQAMTSLLVLQSGAYLQYLGDLGWGFMMCALFTKVGSAPFHFWFPVVAEGLGWEGAMLLFTVQKLGPLVLLSYCQTAKIDFCYFVVAFMSTAVGMAGGLNEIYFRSLLSFSSIGHLGWILLAMSQGGIYYLVYFGLYVVIVWGLISMLRSQSVEHLFQVSTMKMPRSMLFCISIGFMSLGGMPPLLGFVPKWFIIQYFVVKVNSVIVTPLLVANLVTVYYYVRAGLYGVVLLKSVYWNKVNTLSLWSELWVGLNLFGVGISGVIWSSHLH